MLNKMKTAVITNSAYFLPENIVTNNNLVDVYKSNFFQINNSDLDEDSIYKRCGIRERRYVDDSTRLRDLSKNVILKLLENSNTSLLEIDAIILNTLSPETYTPSNASLVLKELTDYFQIKDFHLTCFDVNAACTAPLFAIELANNYIQLGKKKKIIVCSVEIVSRMLNNWEYHTGILFGDGAGAMLIEAGNEDDKGIIDTRCLCVTDKISDINYFTSLSKDFNEKLELQGSKVYKNGVSITTTALQKYFLEKNISVANFDYFIFHQANDRILIDIQKRIGIPDSKMLKNIELVGNTAGASVPICFAKFDEKKQFKKGDRILFCSFGAGYTYGIIDFYY